MKFEGYKDFDVFLDYVDNPEFYGMVIATEHRYFYGSDSLFEEAVSVFRDYDLDFSVNKMARKICFSSGATVSFTLSSDDYISGLRFNAALVLDTDDLTYEKLMKIKKRIRPPCSTDGSLWVKKYK